MSDKFDPPEVKIAALLASKTPRQLAIAYLRATRRARIAEASFAILDGVTSANESLRKGDLPGAIDKIKTSTKVIRTLDQTSK